jgi:hypothetical protein
VAVAKPIVDFLIGLIEIPDEIDPADYITMVIQMFAEYPRAVMIKAAQTIPKRMKRPHIADICGVLDEIYAPIRREEERERISAEARLRLPPPNPYVAPERRAQLVAEARKAFGIPETGLPPKPVRPPPLPEDPDYRRRIAADLEARRARNEQRQQEQQEQQEQQP